MTTKSRTKETRKPKFYAYHVVNAVTEGQKDRWSRIGAFFAHEDGDGGTLVLDLMPVAFTGRIVLRTPKQEEA